MKIVNKNVDDLIPYVNNPRKNDAAVDAVASSIKNFGFKVPIIVDSENEIVAGHTRLKAALKLGMKEVPCIVADDLSKAKIKAFRLADNKVAELAEWDVELLMAELEEIGNAVDMEDFGFDELEVDSIDKVDDYYDIDEVPEEPNARVGDIYKLGDHRLMCGDATSEEDVAALLSGERVALWLTDPPYNVNYEGAAGSIQNDNLAEDDFISLIEKSTRRAFDSMDEGAAFYIFHGDQAGHVFRNAIINCDLKLSEVLVWVKNQFTLSRQDYHWRHEPILYGWKKGAAHQWHGGRKQNGVFEDLLSLDTLSKDELIEIITKYQESTPETVIRFDKPLISPEHPTMKPVGLLTRLIRNSSRKGELVLDLFGGSGSTLIASEVTGRKCCMMELDPKFVDVIVKRWEETTGGEAELIRRVNEDD